MKDWNAPSLRAYWLDSPTGKSMRVWLDPAKVDPPLAPGEVEIDLSDLTAAPANEDLEVEIQIESGAPAHQPRRLSPELAALEDLESRTSTRGAP